MNKEISRTITVCCSDSGAVITVPFDAAEIATDIKTSLEKYLLKNGVAVQWSEQGTRSDLVIRLVQINKGHWLRHWNPGLLGILLGFRRFDPFIEVEWQMTAAGSSPQDFHYVQRATEAWVSTGLGAEGFFGNALRGLLKRAAQQIADKIGEDMLRSMGR
jgi:hypothetical protein